MKRTRDDACPIPFYQLAKKKQKPFAMWSACSLDSQCRVALKKRQPNLKFTQPSPDIYEWNCSPFREIHDAG